MPYMPSLDVAGLGQLFTIMILSLSVFWGIHKAIQIAKH